VLEGAGADENAGHEAALWKLGGGIGGLWQAEERSCGAQAEQAATSLHACAARNKVPSFFSTLCCLPLQCHAVELWALTVKLARKRKLGVHDTVRRVAPPAQLVQCWPHKQMEAHKGAHGVACSHPHVLTGMPAQRRRSNTGRYQHRQSTSPTRVAI
jgi:hypothetical protein